MDKAKAAQHKVKTGLAALEVAVCEEQVDIAKMYQKSLTLPPPD